MYPSLLPHMLGIRATLGEAIELAARHNFTGVDTEGSSLLTLSSQDVEQLQARFEQTATIPGYMAMPPGRISVDDEEWKAALAEWPRIARKAQALGYKRAALVLLPFHETLSPEAAIEEHARRLQEAARILGDYGIRLGLEYIAAPSRRAPYPTHTIWNLAGMLQLLEQVQAPNLGLMLDTFHWHGAGEGADDLKQLRAEQIVVVHANDAPNRPLDQHVVTQRSLPGATGVIDRKTFFQTLQSLGYDGPVTCEPMQPAIDALEVSDTDAICALVRKSLSRVLPQSAA